MAGILLCIAGSRSARSAARVARFLSLRLDSELVLTHPRAREVGGASSERVVAAAVESEAELIVAPSSSHLLGGAWSEDLHHSLERSAPCPVVVVPARLRQPWPLGGSLLCAVDGSDEALVAACVAGDLANRLCTPLTLADAAGGHSADNAARAQALVNSLLERPPPVEPRTIPPSRDPMGALAAVARASCAELVALRAGDEPVREPAPGAVARRVGLPVLVVPPVAHVGPESGHYEMGAA